MDGFDTSTMTYMSRAMSIPHSITPDGYPPPMVPLDLQDHLSNYDADTYAGSEDLSFLPHQQHQHQAVAPPLTRFPSSFDDQYSDVVGAFDGSINQDLLEGENTTIERDNKLLSFSQPTMERLLLDYTYRQTTISLSAQMHGMFFLADSPWAVPGDTAPPPTELTCYRRNLFQITGNITLPRNLKYILTDHGKQIPIVAQELVISATESTEGNAVKIISVPWKTPINANAPLPQPDEKVEREPPTIPLDTTNVQELDCDFGQIPFQWKRLQFRIATANNGRRKELQQHFVVRLKVVATLATGGKIPICEIQSGPVIVRGRSPRNFLNRKDTPLSGSHARKSAHPPVHVSRTTSGDSIRRDGPTSAPATKTEPQPPPPALSVQSFFDTSELPTVPPQLFNGMMMSSGNGHQRTMTAIPQEPFTFDARGYAASSPDFYRAQRPPPPPMSAPINLSLVDDDSWKMIEPKRESTTPCKKPSLPNRPPSFTLNTLSSPSDESADLLYEYFPLGLDDWMPPVDAVYRPHVVHHINVSTDPRDPKAVPRGGRSKRYFSEDMG